MNPIKAYRPVVSFVAVMVLSVWAGWKIEARLKPAIEGAPAVRIVVDHRVDEHEQKIRAAMWEVAKVFGRDDGCRNADEVMGRMVAEAAIEFDIPAKDVAATISVESDCNPYATSSRGAIGLMQVMPSVWKTKFDFQNKVNLLNPKQAIETGTEILAGYEKQFGRQAGMLHYQGTGTGCPTCDGNYVAKILRLADGK